MVIRNVCAPWEISGHLSAITGFLFLFCMHTKIPETKTVKNKPSSW
jgi:hypothetical protein